MGFSLCSPSLLPFTTFYQWLLSKGLSYDTYVSVPDSACVDLQWWSNAGETLPPRSLSPFEASIELFCDASLSGWGCWTSDNREAFGFWSSSESELHINILECMSVLFAFRCFFRSTFNCSILIHTDSTTVLAYINCQGGTVSSRLCDLVLKLWDFCLERD